MTFHHCFKCTARIGRQLPTRSLGDLLPPPPPSEKATASQDQARKSGTDDGRWDGGLQGPSARRTASKLRGGGKTTNLLNQIIGIDKIGAPFTLPGTIMSAKRKITAAIF